MTSNPSNSHPPSITLTRGQPQSGNGFRFLGSIVISIKGGPTIEGLMAYQRAEEQWRWQFNPRAVGNVKKALEGTGYDASEIVQQANKLLDEEVGKPQNA